MGRTKDAVQIDKYALDNAMLANETNAKEVSLRLGHSQGYLAQVRANGGFIKRREYENLKGLLRITDNALIKAAPVQRADEVENIYSPYPVKAGKLANILDEDNAEFIEMLARIGGADKNALINSIIRSYKQNSALAQTLNAAIDAVKALTE